MNRLFGEAESLAAAVDTTEETAAQIRARTMFPAELSDLSQAHQSPVHTLGSTVVQGKSVPFFTVDAGSSLLTDPYSPIRPEEPKDEEAYYDPDQAAVSRHGAWLAVSKALSSKPSGGITPDTQAVADYVKYEKPIEGFTVQDYEDVMLEAFPSDDPDWPILGATDDVLIAPNFRSLLNDPSVTVVPVKKGDQLIGFSLAMPIGMMDPSRADESAETAYIYYTAIEPFHQNRGMVEELSREMLHKLVQNGYKAVERDSVIENGYADKVQETYRAGIVDQYDHNDFEEIGPQRFLRIELDKLPKELVVTQDQFVQGLLGKLSQARQSYVKAATHFKYGLFGGRRRLTKRAEAYQAVYERLMKIRTSKASNAEGYEALYLSKAEESHRLAVEREAATHVPYKPRRHVGIYPKPKFHSKANLNYQVGRRIERAQELFRELSVLKHVGAAKPAGQQFSNHVTHLAFLKQTRRRKLEFSALKERILPRGRVAAIGAAAVLASVSLGALAAGAISVDGERDSSKGGEAAASGQEAKVNQSAGKVVGSAAVIKAAVDSYQSEIQRENAAADSTTSAQADEWQTVTNAPDGFWARQNKQGTIEVVVSKKQNSLWAIGAVLAERESGKKPNARVIDAIADKLEQDRADQGKSTELEFKELVVTQTSAVEEAIDKYQS